MKKLVFFFLGIGLLFSCNNDDNDCCVQPDAELVGTWQLTATLMDPGGGEGEFIPVESDKTITFHQDGSVTSNGNLCDMSIEANGTTSGTYLVSELTYSSSDCINPDYDFPFEVFGNVLIVHHPCFEPCQAKFTKE